MGSGRRRGAATETGSGENNRHSKLSNVGGKICLEIPEEPFAFTFLPFSPLSCFMLEGKWEGSGFIYGKRRGTKLTHPASVSPEIGGNKGQSWRWSIGESLW